MAEGRRIAWTSNDRYSPVQDRAGVHDPTPEDLPAVTARIGQQRDPYHPEFLDEREILRVTYQGDDRCQLRCPGCYTGERLQRPALAPATPQPRLRVPFDDFTGHVDGLGPGLQDFYLLGAEPTMDPAGSEAKLAWAQERGMTVMSITNGAVPADRFDRTFGRAIETGQLYKLIVSLDSMVPEINNELRGSPLAFERTIATIRRCVQRGVPVKVQMTVWPANYPTVLDSVRQLWEIGVRGFAFHCGSVEGVPDFLARGLDHVDPLAWRALCERLYAFRAEHRDELVHLNFPLLYFTEAELRASVIGDDALADAYLDHVAALEDGEESTKPFHACPGLDAPQVYVFANDGADGRGVVSLCNVHSPAPDVAYADYDAQVRRWRVVQDPARNQMQQMADSPHLCPAMRQATGGRSSDRVATERGDLYHACRYLGCNQVPVDPDQFGVETYERAVAFYRAVAIARAAFERRAAAEPYLARLRRVTTGRLGLAERTVAVLRDAVDHAGLDLDALDPRDPGAADGGFVDPDLLDEVRADQGSGHAVPVLLPIWPADRFNGSEPTRCAGGCG